MNIGIIGSGNIGSTLAKHLIKAGHQVMISNSQGPSALEKVSAETGAKAVTVEEASSAKDIVIIAIPTSSIPDLSKEAFAATSAIIVDVGNYYPSRDGAIAGIDQGQPESEWVANTIGQPIIKAFNMVLAQSLASKARPHDKEDRVAVSVAGDNKTAKSTIMKIVDAIGFDPVDGGPLASSWRQQPGTPAYCKDLCKKDLKVALGEAKAHLSQEYRRTADEAAAPYFKK